MANTWLKWFSIILFLAFIGIVLAGQRHWKTNIQQQVAFQQPGDSSSSPSDGPEQEPPKASSKPDKFVAATDPAWLFTNGQWTKAAEPGWGDVMKGAMVGRRAHIMTNSPKVILKQRGIGGTITVYLDNKVAVSQMLPNDNSTVEIPLNPGTSDWHTIDIAFSHNGEIGGMYVEARAEIKAPAPKYAKKLVVIGHSYAEGGNSSDWGLKAYPTILGELLGVETINQGVAGTDVSINSAKDALNSGLNRMKKDVIDVKPDYVLVNYGLNTIPSDPGKVQTDFTTLLTTIRKELPAAPIFVSGIISLPGLSDKQLQPYNTAIQNAVKTIKNGVYIDLAGAWNTGNYAKYLSADKMLPNDEGHKFLADKYATVMKPLMK